MRRSLAVLFVLCALSCVPPARASTLAYTVIQGDSLWTIAAHYGVSVQKLEDANHLTDASILQLGQRIVVPAVAPAAVAHPQTAVESPDGLTKPALHRTAALRSHGTTRVAKRSAHRALESSAQRIAAAQALWSATHAGSIPPAIPGVEPFSVAQRIIAMDARITHTAMRFLGVPYSWGGTSFGGVDCSGLVYTVFARNGIELPRMADEQFSVGRRIAMSLLMPGDLVFFETYTNGASHVGIYLGNGRFIHASLRGVVIDDLTMSYYASRYLGARRLIR